MRRDTFPPTKQGETNQATTLAQAEPAAAALRPTRRRFRVMGLLFVTVVINYLDRSNVSIAAPSLASEFHLDPVQLGLVFSAFSWTYTAFQCPADGWRTASIPASCSPPSSCSGRWPPSPRASPTA